MEKSVNTSKRRVMLKAEARDNMNREYRFNIEFYIFMENGVCIAYCPSLDISSSGNTFNDAISNFYEMFQLYIESCMDSKTLYDDLLAHGWKMHTKSIQPPTFAALMKKPEMKKLMGGGISFEKIVAPARIPAIV